VFSSLILATVLPFSSSSAAAAAAASSFSSSAIALAHTLPSLLSRTPEDASSPEDGPPISVNALRDTTYLPAQIGGIVGAYAVSLVFVAIALLALGKKRREQLNAGNDEIDFEEPKLPGKPQLVVTTQPVDTVPNFSYPSPRNPTFGFDGLDKPPSFVHHSPASSVSGPGINPFVDQNVVYADRAMAQNQLEDMYKHVMEHEQAKQRGEVLDKPVYAYPSPVSERPERNTLSKKERSKPASLNLSNANNAERSSKTSSLLSALRSPKKKPSKALSISSPMMTPQSSTFPRQPESVQLGVIPHREYSAPPPPPPVPTDQEPLRWSRNDRVPLTPDYSPESSLSIDERIVSMDYRQSNGRAISQYTEQEPDSAVTTHSQAPLIGLPSSPKPGAGFPSLPSSPRAGSFHRPNAPSAVRTGGTLPLRAYEPALASPSVSSQTTKQTVFERKGPLSPMSARTPGTAMPYSPYQPFTPCVPMTPSLVTKEERKRMRRMVPKTPTLEMVRGEDDVW
jgi:hypothetical protein